MKNIHVQSGVCRYRSDTGLSNRIKTNDRRKHTSRVCSVCLSFCKEATQASSRLIFSRLCCSNKDSCWSRKAFSALRSPSWAHGQKYVWTCTLYLHCNHAESPCFPSKKQKTEHKHDQTLERSLILFTEGYSVLFQRLKLCLEWHSPVSPCSAASLRSAAVHCSASHCSLQPAAPAEQSENHNSMNMIWMNTHRGFIIPNVTM